MIEQRPQESSCAAVTLLISGCESVRGCAGAAGRGFPRFPRCCSPPFRLSAPHKISRMMGLHGLVFLILILFSSCLEYVSEHFRHADLLYAQPLKTQKKSNHFTRTTEKREALLLDSTASQLFFLKKGQIHRKSHVSLIVSFL